MMKYILFILLAFIVSVVAFLLFPQIFSSKRYAKLGEPCLGAVAPEYSTDCQPGLVCKFPDVQKPGDKGICKKPF